MNATTRTVAVLGSDVVATEKSSTLGPSKEPQTGVPADGENKQPKESAWSLAEPVRRFLAG